MNYRFRTGDKGELVLQVPKERAPNHYSFVGDTQEWRDATVSDLPIMQWLGRESADRMNEQRISIDPEVFRMGAQS